MVWKPVVAGVDGSHESMRAAALACDLAEASGVDVHLVHATKDLWSAIKHVSHFAARRTAASPSEDLSLLHQKTIRAAQSRIAALLNQSLLATAADNLDVQIGRAATVLERKAKAVGAGLVVVGGKHHEALGRWLGGRTALHLLHTIDTSVLVTGGAATSINRILVAVDFSEGAPFAVSVAEQYARLLDASIRLMHVVELLPSGAERSLGLSQEWFFTLSEEVLDEFLWHSVTLPAADRVVRQGHILPSIAGEVREWNADLLVVGSRGIGWVESRVPGSTTEALLNDLPTSLLIVPLASAPSSAQAAEPHQSVQKAQDTTTSTARS